MGSPAEEFCLEQGGDVVCGGYADMADDCICRWPDGYEADLWAYFRGDAKEEKPQPAGTIPSGVSMLVFTGLGLVSLVLLNRTSRRKK